MDFSKYFDHTLLKPDAGIGDIQTLCRQALQYNFASVCVHPYYVSKCAEVLKASPVLVCTVVGFPFGANLTPVKVKEAELACQEGAGEIDTVINIGALKSGQNDVVLNDIKEVARVSHSFEAKVKCILETGLLTQEEKVLAAQLAMEAGADFVKTSTGFLAGGATPEDVALLRQTVGDKLGVKASGGIRDLKTAMLMIEHGATRIGASASVKIIEEAMAKKPL